MAAKGEADKNNNLVCGICLEQYKEPKILPCSHTFCLGCLEKTLKIRKKTEVEKTLLPNENKFITVAEATATEQSSIEADLEEEQVSVPVYDDDDDSVDLIQDAVDFDFKYKVADTAVVNNIVVPVMNDVASTEIDVEASEEEDSNCREIQGAAPSLSCFKSVADPPQQSGVTIKCAVCSREHKVPLGEASHFETDFEAAQALEFVFLQKSASKPLNCGSCIEAKKLVGHCDVCDASICKECSDLHVKLAAFAKHKVVPLNDLTPDEFSSRRKKTHACSIHNEAITYFCTPCAKLICHVCLYEQQQCRYHRVLPLDEADKKLREEVTCWSNKAKENHRLFQEHCKYIGKVELDVVGGEYAARLKKNISEAFDNRIRQLQEEREGILRKVEDHESMTKKDVWAAKDMITTVISNLEAGLRFMEKAQRCANPADRISMNSESSKILGKATKAKWSNHSLPHPLAISTPPNALYQSPCGELVEITSDDVDISNVTNDMQLFPMDPKIGRQVQIEVSVKVSTCLPPTLRVLYGKSEKVFEPIVMFETEPYSWSVSFVPLCGGRHHIQVWIGGIEITSKDIDVGGVPRIGAKVKPGPDWNPPDNTKLYFEGTVTRAKKATHKVKVNWKQTAGGDADTSEAMAQKESEEGDEPALAFSYQLPTYVSENVPVKYTKDFDSVWEPLKHSVQLPSHMSLKSNQVSLDLPVKPKQKQKKRISECQMSLNSENTDAAELEVDHGQLLTMFNSDNSILQEHKWGGPDGLYEVELAL